jgi:protein-S-isoprenylcysteine O-methyltransferase Ste14
LIFTRRRGDRVDLIRAFIVVAGSASVIASLLGWLNAGFQLIDQDLIQLIHRWIGTGLAAIGAAMALWAWRHADAVNSRAMTWALGGVTVALLIQGWFGAAVTHGVEHMMF